MERRELAAELLSPGFVDEGVVIGEFDKGPIAKLLNRPDVADDMLDRTLAIALAEHHVGSAEIASPRAAARGLDGEPVVGTAAQKIVGRDRKLADIDGWKIARVEDAIRFIVFSGAHDRGPDVFAFADDRVIAVL